MLPELETLCHFYATSQQMQLITTDSVAWSVLLMFVSPSKTAEPIGMSFEGLAHVGPYIRWGRVEIPPRRGAIFIDCLAY